MSDLRVDTIVVETTLDAPTSTQTATDISTAITNHESSADPHPVYTTVSEAAAAAPVQSVNGETGPLINYVKTTESNTYTNGQKQNFSPNVNNSGLNVGSVTTTPINAANGDVWYNSATNRFNFLANGVVRVMSGLIAARVLTSGTTYSPTNGTTRIKAILIGAGGGGGGCSTGIGQGAAAAGGGSGSECIVFIENIATGPYTIAIGAGGAGGTNAGGAGATGGTTSLNINAVTYTALGGFGGAGMTAGTVTAVSAGGAGGGSPTNGLINKRGVVGEAGNRESGTVGHSGRGGDSLFGSGGSGRTTGGVGNPGLSFGGGGGGALTLNNSAASLGGAGSAGCIYIEEYY
jgi:hypothetical protein